MNEEMERVKKKHKPKIDECIKKAAKNPKVIEKDFNPRFLEIINEAIKEVKGAQAR